VAPELPGLGVEALFEAMGLADQMREAAQTLVLVAISTIISNGAECDAQNQDPIIRANRKNQ
jgi:hypothetical protein